MDILTWIGANWHNALVIVAMICAVVTAVVQFVKKWLPAWKAMTDEQKVAYVLRLLENLIPIAIGLVTDAESIFGAQTGVLKRSYVIDELYSRVPDAFKPFVTEDNLDAILEKALEKAKVLWDNNTAVAEYIENAGGTMI